MRYAIMVGRILFSAMFINGGMFHFTSAALVYAASKGVPYPELLVPLSGMMAIVGGLCILFGYKTRFGGWMIVCFLIPVTLIMHQFWMETDIMQKQIQTAMFLKNLAMLGGAFYIARYGGGEVSVDAWQRHRYGKLNRHSRPRLRHV